MKPQAVALRAGIARKARLTEALFDTGTEAGLIRKGLSGSLPGVDLVDAIRVLGIGGGRVHARRLVLFQIRVVRKWCRYQALVVPDDALDVDLLIGEDFLLAYGLRVNPRGNRVEVAYPLHFKRMTRRELFVASPRGAER